MALADPPPRTPSVAPSIAPLSMASILSAIRGAGNSGGTVAPAASGPSSTPGLPDLSKMVGDDPAYVQAQADEKAALDAAGAQRDAAVNSALVQFGMVPDIAGVGASMGFSPTQLSAILGQINPNTAGLADQYTKAGDSVLGRLNQAHDQALASLRASLAARGALESGATGVGVGLENQNYQHNETDAYNTLLNSLLGYENSYAGAQHTAQTGLETAASDAYNRAVQLAEQYPGLYSSAPGGSSGGGGGGGGGSTPPPTGGAGATAGLTPPPGTAVPSLVSEHGLGGGYTSPSPASLVPHAVAGVSNPTGLSSRRRGGVFSIH